MSTGESFLKKEIKLPKLSIVKKIPKSLPEWLATACIGAYLIALFVMAFLAIYYHSIDYTGFIYQRIYEYYLHPFSTFTGFAAIIVAVFLRKASGAKVIDWRGNNRTYFILAVLVVWMIFSTIYNGINYFTKFGAEYLGESFFASIKYFIILFPVATLIKRDIIKRIMFRFFIIISCILVIAAFYLWQTQIESKFIIGWEPAFTSIYTNTNYYGYFLSIAVPFSAMIFVVEKNTLWKCAGACSLIANTIALSFNNTMGAWVGCLFACVFMLVAFKIRDGEVCREAIISFVLFLCTFIIIGMINGNLIINFLSFFCDVGFLLDDPNSMEALHAGSGRWIIWIRSTEQIISHPLFGIGHEGVIARGIANIVGNNRPHNEYLQYALFYGIPAGIFYFVGCLSIYLRVFKDKTKLDDLTLVALVAAFGYLVGAFFGLTLYSTTPYLFIMLGFGYMHMNK